MSSAVSCLLDVIVFAGGDSPDLMPLSAFEPKHMLRICNRPLIWYCLAPWIDAGCRSFFICVNEDYASLRAYLSREFSGVEFFFVLVPLNLGDHPSTTCDAVKAYLQYKESLRIGEADNSLGVHGGDEEVEALTAASSSRDALRVERAAMAGLHRDAVLLSCDTILTRVDVSRYVSNFYNSLASASLMMVRPCAAAPPRHGGSEKRKHGGKAAAASTAERKSFTNSYTCVAYEEDDVIASMAAGDAPLVRDTEGSPVRSDPFTPSSAGGPGSSMLHHRLHYMYPLDEEPELRITMAFAARRPHLTFAADVVDAHVCIVRHWVLHFIAEHAGQPECSVYKDVLPLMARSQHATININEDVFITPEKKIKHPIPTHWTRKGQSLTIQALNAAGGTPLDARVDNLRVFCTLIEEHPEVPTKIYRINTRDSYQAMNEEIIAAKCQHLGLDEPAPSVTAKSAGRRLGQKAGAATLPVVDSAAPACSSALSLLLPDNPFTLRERVGEQQVFVVGSFLDSVPPPQVYITRSVIGANVTIGAGARITNSVVLANVEIGAKASIINSVIGSSAVVNAGRRVVNSTVGPRCIVEQDEHDRIVE